MTGQIAGVDTDTPTTCAIHGCPVAQYENGHGGYTILCDRCFDVIDRALMRRGVHASTAAAEAAEALHSEREQAYMDGYERGKAAITDEQVEAVAHALFDWKYLTGLVPWERASPEDARGFRLMAYVAIKAANGWEQKSDA